MLPDVSLTVNGAAARLVGVVPVPAKVVAVDRGRSWTWHVGPMRLEHVVEPEGDRACRLVFRLRGPIGAVQVYGPVVHALMLNLARVAQKRGGTRWTYRPAGRRDSRRSRWGQGSPDSSRDSGLPR